MRGERVFEPRPIPLLEIALSPSLCCDFSFNSAHAHTHTVLYKCGEGGGSSVVDKTPVPPSGLLTEQFPCQLPPPASQAPKGTLGENSLCEALGFPGSGHL